jgi:hypothetical protein
VPKDAKVTCLNDDRPITVTSVAMKSFERLIMNHINTIIPDTLDPLQFAYHPNRSTDDVISIALHTALSHLDKRNTYVRMLFIDYSSAFNTIVPSKLITKLRIQGLKTLPLQLDPGEHLPLQLDLGLPNGTSPGGEGRQQHIPTLSVVHTAQYITGAERPAIQDLYTSLCIHYYVFDLSIISLFFFLSALWEGLVSKHFTNSPYLLLMKHLTNTS